MDCYDVSVTGVTKDGYEIFTRNVQLLGEMPQYLISGLRFAAQNSTERTDSLHYEALAELMETLFEAGE